MRRIILVLATFFLLYPESYGRGFEVSGGLDVDVCPDTGETTKAIAELLVTDPSGRQSGFDVSKGTVVQGIPNAGYGKDRIDDLETGEPGSETALFETTVPSDGIYKIMVIGTAYGRYALTLRAYDVNFDKEGSQEFDDATYPGKIDNYEITYSSAPGSQIEVTHTGSSEIPVFDGKGQRPDDVSKFLQYFNPAQARTELSPGTPTFNLSIIYGNTINRETFSAVLEGQDITRQFDPLPGKMEIVKIPLAKGTNTLLLSIKGVRTDGKIAEDTDMLVFIVP